MRTCGILFFLSFSVFAQEPDFHYKAFSIKVDSVTSGVEVRKIQAVLALEKDLEPILPGLPAMTSTCPNVFL